MGRLGFVANSTCCSDFDVLTASLAPPTVYFRVLCVGMSRCSTALLPVVVVASLLAMGNTTHCPIVLNEVRWAHCRCPIQLTTAEPGTYNEDGSGHWCCCTRSYNEYAWHAVADGKGKFHHEQIVNSMRYSMVWSLAMFCVGFLSTAFEPFRQAVDIQAQRLARIANYLCCGVPQSSIELLGRRRPHLTFWTSHNENEPIW